MFIAGSVDFGLRSVGAPCFCPKDISLLKERAISGKFPCYKHLAPTERSQVSQLYSYPPKRRGNKISSYFSLDRFNGLSSLEFSLQPARHMRHWQTHGQVIERNGDAQHQELT